MSAVNKYINNILIYMIYIYNQVFFTKNIDFFFRQTKTERIHC